ncbi:hypothetical protein GCM10027034_23520 [Ramlibacter solisilvae]|uniref:J domain-containing protein n=1 Tax=Ramlibacter tataouinensis TaxID=94132 RepID=A0A127JPY9_9BURK|nr:hypothetical protein [Ramlibacter tataouinensis]AMO22061.1 hypothetical protein UC35_03180 [Ramlibacter tataouinensis]
MGGRRTLYELLGVAQTASVAELQSAYRQRVAELEAACAGMNLQDYKDQAQLLRVALSTLSDPVTRVGYDAKLTASSAAPAAAAGLTLAPLEPKPDAAGSAGVRADALSMRADALALRADAMLVRAGLDLPAGRSGGMAAPIASGAVKMLRRLASALGLLVLVGMGAFMLTRCTVGDPAARRVAQESQAAEKAALQEYYQTHGVRPANMAELELLEAERRRRSNQERQQDLNQDKQERQERQFEQDARRRADEVSRQLRHDEERARYEAQREAQRERNEKMAKEERERMQQEAELLRAERERERWRQELRQ